MSAESTQQMEFAISRIDTQSGVYRAEGTAELKGMQIIALHYTEVCHLTQDGWQELDLSHQQTETMLQTIYSEVSEKILEDVQFPTGCHHSL
uniref:hypothetical protein n=1 Tax=Thaumasiovibrio occultus TaxID=1891184 RepID=UPI00131DAC6A|nr:hypothetical protein [Thaumasiovibrio occultus]